MITKDNITEILLTEPFNFTKRGNIYTRHYGTDSNGFDLKYNEVKKEFNYPQGIDGIETGRKTTMDAHQKESYVVFLCVAQLFARGYEPKHIKLEAQNYESLNKGFCDILVRDGSDDKVEFLIIECKTADLSKKTDEFRKHWAKTLRNGDQLFRYFNTYRRAKYLCLFSCDYPAYTDGGTIKHRFENIYNVISLVDNEKILADPKTHSFEELRTKQGSSDEFFKVWKNTYHQDKNTRGIFEPGIEAFSIGKKTYNIDDLDPVDEYMLGKKYNNFAVVLRKHAVSSHENAFDKLVNLFLAKIVDETDNPSELKFQWKGAAYDDYFSLQDRLTVLYQEGMRRFFNDEVSYVEDKKIDDAFNFLTSKADVAREQIKKYFHELKYYNNNPFAFLDVHNEDLFFQNAVILTDVISMIQDIHLTEHNDNNQFLGDLFEGFLNKGVHQSEGQFFTPIPIVRFLVSSLPLEKIIGNGNKIPKVIDYACGAGHFLTEYARQIRPYVIKSVEEELATTQSETEKNLIIRNKLNEHFEQIKGIEKDYRLSKVSQVAAYMYGMDGVEIHFADGLSDVSGIKDGSFKVLIANPPYSVSGFLETLPDEILEKYSLYDDSLSVDKNKAIETFFIERAVQLLAPEGVAAIILPNSVLTNDGLYLRSREIVLKNFDIVAICEFGGRTFGQTNTNTITLFLRKKPADCNIAQHYLNRVDEWFKGNMADDECYKDTHLLQDYIEFVGYNIDDYLRMLKGVLTDSFLNEERINGYVNVLLGGKAPILPTEAKKVRDNYSAYIGGKGYEKDSFEKRENKKAQAILDFVQAMEKEKLYYFLLAASNSCDVLVMKTPESTKKDNKIEQRFLGYEWSNRKGDEGLKYLNVKTVKKAKSDEAEEDDTISQVKGINGIVTPLFNPLNLIDDYKINTLICKNFNNKFEDVPEDLSEYVNMHSLTSLLDFKQTGFDKNININIAYKVKFQSKYELVALSKYVIVNPSKTEIKGLSNDTEVSFIEMASVSDRGYISNKVSKTLEVLRTGSYTYFAENDIIVAKITPCMENGKCAIAKDLLNGIAMGSTEFHVFRCMPQILNGYLFALLNNDYVRSIAQKNMKGSSGHKRVPETFYKDMLIPLPPLEVQEKIANEISDIDEKCKKLQNLLVENQELISECISSTTADKTEYTLAALCKDIYAGGDKPQNFTKEKTDICGIPVYSNGTGDNALFGYTDKARTEEPCVTIAARGTLGYTILHEEQFFPIVRLIVAIPNQNIVLPKYLKYALDEVEFINTGSATPQLTVPQVRKYRISVPSLEEQKLIIAQIELYEARINEARYIIESSSAKKQEILDKYLK
jgi:type I restriction-modification system DNA methylase subunit